MEQGQNGTKWGQNETKQGQNGMGMERNEDKTKRG